MTLLLLAPAIIVVALILVVLARRKYVDNTAQAFALGIQVGKGIALAGDSWVDEQLRKAGIDPAKLPGVKA